MGSWGNFIYRPSYGASGVSEYTNFDTGLVSIDTETHLDQLHRQSIANVHGLTFTGPGAGGGLDSDTLDGLHSASFLLSGGTALDSAKLGGVLAAGYILSGDAVSYATSASNSDMVDNIHASGFLLAGGNAQTSTSASNSDKLDGYHSTAFASSAHASTHLSAGADTIALDTLGVPTDLTVLNVTTSAHGLFPKLTGDISQVFHGDGSWGPMVSGGGGDVFHDGTIAFTAMLSGTTAYFSEALSASDLYGTAQVALSASNADKVDTYHAASFLLSGGTAVAATSASDSDKVGGYLPAAFLLSGGTAVLATAATSASDSDKLDGYHYQSFLLSGGTAVSASDSNKLNGLIAAGYLLSGGNAQTATSASDSDTVDSCHAAAFLLAGGNAQTSTSASDSDKLDGYHYQSFLLSGGNAQTATSASSADMLDGLHAASFLQSTVREVTFCVPGTLTTGDQAPWIHLSFAGTVNSAYAIVKTASTAGALTADILKCLSTAVCATTVTWVSIFSTKITIDQDELSTKTAAISSSLNGAQTFVANDLYRINIDGAGTGAADLTIGMKVTV